LIYICEGLGLFDSNESEPIIKIDFMYRNQCAHPNNTPFEDAHVVVFFTDINKMVLTNPKFDLTTST
jgi:hypothetical protein